MWIDRLRALTLGAYVLAGGAALAEPPLSAIDWLSDSVSEAPVAAPPSAPPAEAAPAPITVRPIGAPSLDAVGLLPASVTGLPQDLWGRSEIDRLAALIRAERVETLPSVQALLYTLLLAELDAPAPTGDAQDAPRSDGVLLLARLDKLLELGALDQAQALLERAGPTAAPELFRRWFDVSLLTGHEDRACAAMRATPDIAPTFPARVFCLARGGDWNAAALTLETGRVLGFVTDEEEAILLRFLELMPDEGALPLPPPSRPTPLTFRMFEAIGEPLPTAPLPLAFAQADLRSTAGWKPRLEAAERLARAGAITPNRLLGIYTERLPAASGGIWDRVDALQALDVAMIAGDRAAIARSLPAAWAAMERAELEVPFARLYGARLAALGLTGEAGALAFRVGLLSDAYETVADAHAPADPKEAFLAGLARGDLTGIDLPDDATLTRAIADGFNGTADPGPAARAMLEEGRLGEAVLTAIDLVTEGALGDMADVGRGLVLLRGLGLEDTARRAALELMILERRG